MSARAGDVSLENAHDGARAFHGGAGACAAPILAHYPCAHVYDGHHECADVRAPRFGEYVHACAAQSDAAKVRSP